jgi:PAS domain S-box-containing protein
MKFAAYNPRMLTNDDLQKAILNNIPDQAWLADGESRYILVNDAFVAACGLTEIDILGKTPVEVWPAHWGEAYMKTDEQVVASGLRTRYEERRQSPDGQVRWFDIVKTPLRNAQGQVVGTVGISRDVTDRKRMEQELLELSAYLQSVREEERTHISRELHDELGQSLTALQLGLGVMEAQLPVGSPAWVDHMNSLKDLTDETISAVKRIASDLRPPLLDDLGLDSAMEWLLGSFSKRTGVAHDLLLPEPPLQYNADVSTAFFRIVQEALTNVSRHGQATRVTVELMEQAAGVTLKITDDGKGMDATAQSTKKSLGLIGMRERCVLLGGRFDIASLPGEGTRIEVHIPKPC